MGTKNDMDLFLETIKEYQGDKYKSCYVSQLSQHEREYLESNGYSVSEKYFNKYRTVGYEISRNE